jgi:hypothetical protein
MRVYKQFTTDEVISQPFIANKLFNITGSAITGSNIGIDIFSGLNLPSTLLFSTSSDPTTGLIDTKYKRLVYDNIRELYYSNNVNYYADLAPPNLYDNYNNSIIQSYTGSISSSFGRFYNYPQTDLYYPKYFPTSSQNINDSGSITVISIPSKIFGNHIVPNTFRLNCGAYSIMDDGEGNLVTSPSTYGVGTYGYSLYLNENSVGNIIYQHGIAIITQGPSSSLADNLNINNLNISFSSSINIYENRWNCTLKDNESTFSQNPSIVSSSNGELYGFATSSYFNPYITTIGLYNDNNDLLAVAKLAKPLQISNVTDMNIYVSIDM